MLVTPENVHTVLRKHMLVDGYAFVLDLKKSQGCRIVDARTGSTYFDFFSFYASSPIGMNHPDMVTPEFKEKLATIAVNKPTNSDVYSVELAEAVSIFSEVAIPAALPYLFFISGGTLAVENCLKAAFDWKVRKNFTNGNTKLKGHKIIHFKDAFHGRSGYTLTTTNTADPAKTEYFPVFDWPRIDNPKIGFPLNDESLDLVKKAEEESIRQIKSAITSDPDDIAALIIEPIQGEGGDNHFRKNFFKSLRVLSDENDFLLIFDEIQTGIGLTGKMWCYEHFDVVPDMISFGKKAQVCGMLAGSRLDEIESNVFNKSSRINSTFGGNLVDIVRFGKYLEIIQKENLLENARIVGKYLLSKLNELAGRFDDKITNVRGRGLMCAFDVPSVEIRDRILKFSFEYKLLILGSGLRSIRFRPILNIKKSEIDEGLGILDGAINRALKD